MHCTNVCFPCILFSKIRKVIGLKDLTELKKHVYEANIALQKTGLVVLTWGNVSGIDRESGLVVIKPSGVPYDDLSPDDMSVVSLDGAWTDGRYRPSSDVPTHLALYREFHKIGGIVHTHSVYATAFAQAGKALPALGTTHADAFYGSVPCTRALTEKEVAKDYEENTGLVIIETFINRDYFNVPAVLVRSHGPFTWGETPMKAVETAVTLETAAQTALSTLCLNPEVQPPPQYLLDRHYYRKHGAGATYGQGGIE